MENNHYQTADLYIGAALLTSGIQLVKMDSLNGTGKMVFIFEKTAKTDETVRAFINDTLTLNVRSFLSNWKVLKLQLIEMEEKNGKKGYGRRNFNDRI